MRLDFDFMVEIAVVVSEGLSKGLPKEMSVRASSKRRTRLGGNAESLSYCSRQTARQTGLLEGCLRTSSTREKLTNEL